MNNKLERNLAAIQKELEELKMEEEEVDKQLESFSSLDQPFKLTNAIQICATDSAIHKLFAAQRSKVSLVTQLANRLSNLASTTRDLPAIRAIYAENHQKRLAFAQSLPPAHSHPISLEPGPNITPKERQLCQDLFLYDFPLSSELEETLLSERVRIFRGLP